MYEVADGPDEVRRAVRRQLAHGADLIKVMATGAMLSSETEDARAIQYALDELRAAVEVAHDNFKPVAAHAHALQGIVNAVEAGVDSIEHCTFADDDALAAHRPRRHLRRAHDLRRRAAVPRPRRSSRRCPSTCASGWSSSTTSTWRPSAGPTSSVRASPWAPTPGRPGNHHGLNAHECVLMSTRCGLSPAESIRTATVERRRAPAARATSSAASRWAYADVIACAGDPFESIEELTRLMFVMKGGEVARHDAGR